MFDLRIATAADVPFLWTMLFEAAHADDAGMTLADLKTAPELARYVAGWGAPGDLGVVGSTDSIVPAGAAWIRLLTAGNAGYGYVDEHTPELAIAVLPQLCGSGLGTAMLGELLREAASHYDRMCLSVRKSSAARRLYERFEFEVVPGSDIVNGIETGSVTMVRVLRRPDSDGDGDG